MDKVRFTTDDPGEDIEIAGIRYQPNNSQRAYRVIHPEGSGAATGWATLEPDPRNHYDSHAVRVCAFGRRIGYLPSNIARKYQDYTMEAERTNQNIEVPMRLRARNYQGELRVFGSIYLPDLSVLAERFPNVKLEDPEDDSIPEWADAEAQKQDSMTTSNDDTTPKKSFGGGCCGIWGIAAVILVALVILL